MLSLGLVWLERHCGLFCDRATSSDAHWQTYGEVAGFVV